MQRHEAVLIESAKRRNLAVLKGRGEGGGSKVLLLLRHTCKVKQMKQVVWVGDPTKNPYQ